MEPTTFRVPADLAAPAAARRIIHETGVAPEERLADVLLAVSELISNAVKHGSNPSGMIEMRVARSDRTIRVEVADGGQNFDFGLDREVPSGGVGLRLVSQISERMGIDSASGTVVWFEVDVD